MIQALRFQLLFLVIFLHALPATSQISTENLSNIYQDKMQERAEKRFIKQGKHIFSIYATKTQYPLVLKDPSGFFPSEMSKMLILNKVDAFYFNYQYTLPKNFFVESGFKYVNQFTNLDPHEYYVGNWLSNRSGISILSLSLGSGYRFIGENNLRFFDVHAGFTLGMSDNPVGNGDEYFETQLVIDYYGNVNPFNYYWKYTVSSRFGYGFYLGISKDIRITQNLYVSTRYHYQFGKNSEFTAHEIHYVFPANNINNTVRASNTLKGQMFALGLRWYFD